MKRVIAALVTVLALMTAQAHAGNGNLIVDGQLGIGTTTPAASAALEVNSATKGLLPPRMASAQRNAIASPVTGLLIFNTTENTYNFYTGTKWIPLGDQAGFVQAYAGDTAPEGWLECDGSDVSRTEYPALFAAIKIIYGKGDDSTTFNLPDLRGEFIRGWDNSRGIDSGRALGTAQTDDLKSHYHTVNDVSGVGSEVDKWPYGDTGSGAINDAILQTNSYGGTETRPRNVALMYCIKY